MTEFVMCVLLWPCHYILSLHLPQTLFKVFKCSTACEFEEVILTGAGVYMCRRYFSFAGC